jgi:hypothetical protein
VPYQYLRGVRTKYEELYSVAMLRLFSVFPGGTPGFALVLLRLSAAAMLWLPVTHGFNAPLSARFLALAGISLLLALGAATPLVAFAASFILFSRLADPSGSTLVLDATAHGATALALALIGPGAFSVDARLFGRRIVASSD